MDDRVAFITSDDNIMKLPVYVTGISDNFCGRNVDRPFGYEDNQLALCTGGEGVFIHGSFKTAIKASDVFFFRKGIPHSYYPTTEQWSLRWVTFNGTGFGSILDYLKYHDVEVFKISKGYDSSIFTHIYNNALHSNHYSSSVLVQELLINTAHTLDNENRMTRLDDVIKYISKNYYKDIPLEKLSDINKTSVSYLCRLFKEVYGTTPAEYIIRYRINASKVKLINTNMNIREIALSSGFNQLEYFCYVFKKYERCTPSEFRKTFGK